MPTYGYECLSCDNQFEIFQSIKDDALKTCDVCGGALRKRIYPVGIAFKGDGFYVNDYAAKPESKAPKAPAEASSEGAKPDAAHSDAGGATETGKAEAKPEPVKTEPSKTETKAEAKPDTKTPAAV